jgi:hypothetical protein
MEPKVTYYDEEGLEIHLPAKYEVCRRCEGSGTHVNPNIDGHGITPEEFEEDPVFRDAYLAGVYDVSCFECKGLRVVAVVAAERCDPEQLQAYHDFLREEALYRAAVIAEVRAGA